MKNEIKRKSVMVITMIVAIAAIIGNIYVIIKGTQLFPDTTARNMTSNGATFLSISALLTACIYIGMEFNKLSAKYYKLFILTFIAAQLTTVLNIILAEHMSVMDILGSSIVLGLLSILWVAKDFGKIKSLIFSYVILGWNLFALAYTIHGIHSTIGIGTVMGRLIFLRMFASISLATVLVIMTHLKYYDKKMRNTK